MKHNAKVFLIYFISFIVIFSIFRFLIGYLFPDLEHIYLLISTAIITVILSPKLDRAKDGDGTRYQLRWIFKKEPIMK
ncbi:hypothetical protein MKO06_13425 [Gramella sp. GC03-9]|uniref:Uncharacterized protein n=1 Tax=Christiangramia oceanisediminis TaxID=2920386 RepID=A0A9X2KZ64_9FLAO|nr:hypothetical protein [Gramella oceanisediminis]MCP9200914.1 hypothetical protein [Gramella oceanisediminis]